VMAGFAKALVKSTGLPQSALLWGYRPRMKGADMDPRHIKIIVPRPVEAPRGAAWAAVAVVWAWRAARRLTQALRGTGRARPAQRRCAA
jgi:hypothetical protein